MARRTRRPSVLAMEPLPVDHVDPAGPLGQTEPGPTAQVEPTEQVDLLLRDLRSSRRGLSSAEAQRRLIQYGPNELRRRGGLSWQIGRASCRERV